MGAAKERLGALYHAVRHLPSHGKDLWGKFRNGNPSLSAWHQEMKECGRRHLVIVMIERLGDIVACTPIAKQLKEKDSSLAIAWVCSKKYADALNGNPYIDAVFFEDSLSGWLLSKAHLAAPIECIELFLDSQRCCWTGLRLPGRRSGVNHSNYLEDGSNLLLAYARASGTRGIIDIEPELYLDGAPPQLPPPYGRGPLLAVHFDSEDPDRRLAPEVAHAFVEQAHEEGWSIVELGLRPVASLTHKETYFPGRSLSLRDQILFLKSAHHFAGVDSAFLHCANAFRIPSTLILGKFRHFKSFQTFSGSFFLSEQCMIVRGEKTASNISADMLIKLVPQCRETVFTGDKND
ncbi:MAG TPA: hypothetical protein VFW68_05490 [Rhodocyclaceae bacterium]|nr:hypothetical protein [Rhodocyclaceae bacterium]